MFKNYFKTALRNFGRHKLFTFINVIGLSIGISAALVIYLIVNYDFSFDKFHRNSDRIYRVVTNSVYAGEINGNSGVTGPLPAATQAEIPGIEKSAPFFTLSEYDVKIPQGGKEMARFRKQENVVLADGRYFDLFNYEWLAGSPKTALNEPYQVVLTADQAKLYFPALSPAQVLGKIVVYEDSIKTTVTGIVQTIKENTDFKFHDFISYSTGASVPALKQDLKPDLWGRTTSRSQFFVQLAPNVSRKFIEKRITDMYFRHKPLTAADKGTSRSFGLQPLDDLHFNAQYNIYDGDTLASKPTLYGLLVIAAFLLLLGCINFINLTTAQASHRAKEIGIRKTIGSTRTQLVAQLLSETLLITLLAVLISLAAAPFVLKLFSDFIAPDIRLDLLQHPGIFVFLSLLVVIVGLLSGFYPALILSGYKPVQVLKSQSAIGTGKTRSVWLRKSLTVTQFIIAQFFIMATILVGKQTYYAIHKDLGFKKDAILYINTPWKNNNESQKQLFYNKLAAIPQIALISRGTAAPSSSDIYSTECTYKDGKRDIKLEIHEKYADQNYIKLYGIKLLAGRNIQPNDTSRAFLVNETYIHTVGFKNPADAVGKMVDDFDGNRRMQIVGVIADFHQESVHSTIKPLAVLWYPDGNLGGTFQLSLKPETAGGHEWKTAMNSITQAWKDAYPDADFEYHFFDESIAKFYEREQHMAKLLSWAAGLSILISCLGLLGLAMYTTNTRTKEIGVRKVLGATVMQVVGLLSTELMQLVLLSFIVVTPFAWLAMHKWMQEFADRTAISWWIFAFSGAGMLLTALITLSTQTVRAALANPVKSLRSE